MWTLIMKLPHTEVKFYPKVKSQTGLSSLRVSCKHAQVSNLYLIELIFKWPIMVFLAYMTLCCWIFERLLSIVDSKGEPLKEEELLTLRRLCVLSCQAVLNIFRKSLKFLANLDIPVSSRCSFPLFKCLLTLMLSCKIRSIPLFSQNSFNRELTFSTLVLHASPLGAMVEITILFLFVLRTLTSRDISEQISSRFFLSLDRLYQCVKCMRLGQSLFE